MGGNRVSVKVDIDQGSLCVYLRKTQIPTESNFDVSKCGNDGDTLELATGGSKKRMDTFYVLMVGAQDNSQFEVEHNPNAKSSGNMMTICKSIAFIIAATIFFF